MFNKKVLSMAVASVATGMSLSAQAVIDLDADTGEVVYAQETVLVNTAAYAVADAGTDLDVEAEIGVGVADADQIFVRYEVTNGIWGTALTDTTLDIDGTTGNIAQDGGASDSVVIYAVTAPVGGFQQDDGMTLALDALGITVGNNSVDISVGVFETLTLAINGTTPLNSASTNNAVSLAAALTTTYTPDSVTADVETDFTTFEGNATSGALGIIDFDVAAGRLNATDGSGVALGDIVDLSATEVEYEGAFDFGSFALGSAACVTATALTVDTTTNASATADGDDVDGDTLCVEVSGTESIPEAEYTATVDFDQVNATPAFVIPDSTGDAGTIERNGTTVEIAYLTTFQDYNQRIILVNRNTVDVAYNITFSTEAGVTATAGSAAMGTLTPGQNLVLRASDVVTLTGGTRCAATFTAVSPSGRIDVATTQVNLSDGGTDTVTYN